MKQYIEAATGSFTLEGMSIPAVDGNRHYRQMQEEIDAGDAEIIPFDHAAKAVQDLLDIEKAWVSAELTAADIEVQKHDDGHTRVVGTREDWIMYRNALRDRVQSGVISSGDRPPAPGTV